MWRVPAAGGAATAVTQVDLSRGEFVHTWPSFLPDGKSFLYFRSGPRRRRHVRGFSRRRRREPVASADIGHRRASGLREWPPLLSARRTLMAQPFDARRLEPDGLPVPWPKMSGSRGLHGIFRCPTKASSSIGPHRRPAPSSSARLTGRGRPSARSDRRGLTGGLCCRRMASAQSRKMLRITCRRPLDAGPCQRPAHALYIRQERVLAGGVVSDGARSPTRPAVWATRSTRNPPQDSATSRCC